METKTKHAYITAVLLGAVLAAGAMFAFPLQTASATGECENNCGGGCGCPGGSTTQNNENNNNNQASATATGINVGVGDINVGPLV